MRSRCPCVIQLPHRIHQTWKALCEITPRQVWREQGGGTGMSTWIFFLFSNIFRNNLQGISFILMLISCKQKDGYTPMDTYTHAHTIGLYRVRSIMQTKPGRSLADASFASFASYQPEDIIQLSTTVVFWQTFGTHVSSFVSKCNVCITICWGQIPSRLSDLNVA